MCLQRSFFGVQLLGIPSGVHEFREPVAPERFLTPSTNRPHGMTGDEPGAACCLARCRFPLTRRHMTRREEAGSGCLTRHPNCQGSGQSLASILLLLLFDGSCAPSSSTMPFQGVDDEGNSHTLGRGGPDTTG